MRAFVVILALALFIILALALGACSQKSEAPVTSPAFSPVTSPVTSNAPNSQTPNALENIQGLTKTPTENGSYLVTLRPENPEYVIGKAQNWIATVTDAQGKIFTPSALYFDGGMPGHGHGLPSAPQFTQHLGGSGYKLEGMRLNMPGDWRFVVTVGGPAGIDSAVFNLNIQPGPVQKPNAVPGRENWSAGELALIASLRLDQLPPAQDTSNRFMGNPKAIELGKALFNDPMLSASGEVSCATCHQEDKGFADGNRFSVGSKQTQRHTPSLLGAAHANWFYWDGRRDSLWSQALTPIETNGEMDNNRTDVVRYIASHQAHADAFRQLAQDDGVVFAEMADTARFPLGASPFGDGKFHWHRMSQSDRTSVNRAYATLGKLIAAYEAELQFEPSRFDRWAKNIGLSEEIAHPEKRV